MKGTAELFRKLLKDGEDAGAVMNEALVPAMNDVGVLSQKGEFYLPEMMGAAKAMQPGMEGKF